MTLLGGYNQMLFPSRAAQIHVLLTEAFHPLYMEVKDVSHEHHTHSTEETHFKVILVSNKFNHQSRVQRHKAVYQCLHVVMPVQNATSKHDNIHALALHLFTALEWENQVDKDLSPPKCRGGFNEH
jgi:BolA family transcriptional regulator, general stress-responsive regulator